MLLIGGLELKEQRKIILLKKPRILFATLGRLLEHIEKEYISLERLNVFTIDEADKFNVDDKKKAWQHLDGVFTAIPY